MGEMTRIVELLKEQRQALVDQLAAVDKAIAALHAADAVDEDDTDPAATQVKARRTQTDSHKHAIAVGKRNARNSRDAAKGLMRDIQPDAFRPAVGSKADAQAPRLVKKKI
jgi:hypothetical protein